MPARGQQQDRLNVALAAVTCGRLSNAASVSASRGRYLARADEYGVNVTLVGPSSSADPAEQPDEDPVLELWRAEMLTLSSPLKGTARRSEPLERARVAARTVRDHDLDSLRIEYPDGVGLSADRFQVVLYGSPRGLFRRRDRLVCAALGELL
jgi:hypothetical protein